MDTVYPRVCGGTADLLDTRARDGGLSPRVRGNHVESVTANAGLRSIPACAGEPLAAITDAPQEQVYPRVCGGTSLTCSQSGRVVGLSPRVRGNQLVLDLCPTNNRSIPACAGEPGSEGYQGR